MRVVLSNFQWWIGAHSRSINESAEGLVAREQSATGEGFVSGYAAFRFTDNDPNVIQIANEDAAALGIENGGRGWILPFVWQTRR